MRSLRTAGVIVVLAGCNYENPGFKVKGSGTGSGASETGESGSGVTTETSVSSTPPTTTGGPETTTEPVTSMTTTTGPAESSSGEAEGTSTTGEPLNNDCQQASTVDLTVVFDSFLVDRSWNDASPCALLQEVAPDDEWEQGTTYCRDRNFGALAALPLIDVPNQDGRDVIHYLVRFDMKPLLDESTQQPVQFVQIQAADLWLTIKRLGVGAKVGAYALNADQAWTEGNKSGEPAGAGEVTYRCRVSPATTDPVKPCLKDWAFKVPIPVEASPMREQATDALPKEMAAPLKISFLASDFEGGLEGFFSEAGHHGFFIGLPPFDPGSTGDKVKVYAQGAAEADIKLSVHYCPAKQP